MDAVFLFQGKLPVLVDELYFVGIEPVDGDPLGFRLGFRVADEIVHGGVEKVGNQHQRRDVRFNFVIFVFVDGLLCQANSIRKFLLADSVVFPERAEIFYHSITF